MAGKPGKRDKDLPIEVDTAVRLDARLADVWAFLWEVDHDRDAVAEGTVAGLLRLAYLSGYQDALVEPVRGVLFAEVGLPIPDRISPERAEAPRPSRKARRGNSGT